MFKLCTDPTKYPRREVDLTSCAGSLILTPRATPESQDLTYPRPDGGLNVVSRARRTVLELEASTLLTPQVEDLEELLGLSDGSAPATAAYIFPPFDTSTILSFPLQESLTGWALNPTTRCLEKTDLAFSRANIGTSVDRWGDWTLPSNNIPKWQPGPMGAALVIDPNWNNQVDQSHPFNGALGWTAGVGTPTLEWDATTPSPASYYSGSLRCRRAAGVPFTITSQGIISPFSNTRCLYSIWLRGNCTVDVALSTASESHETTDHALSPTEWTRIDLDIDRVGVSTVATFTITAQDNGQDKTLWVGPHLAWSYTPSASTRIYSPVSWTPYTSAAKDYVSAVIPRNNPGAFTVSVMSTVPPRDRTARWWFIGGGSGDTTNLDVLDGFFRTTTGGQDTRLTPNSAEWDAAAGRPCVLTLRFGPDGTGGWRVYLDVAYTLTDGGRVQRWSTYRDGAVGADYAPADSLNLGGFDTAEPATLGLSWFRYDGRTWSNLELQTYERTLLESGFRDVFRMVQGRRFLLGDPSLEQIRGTLYTRATIPAREIDIDPRLAVIS